MARPPVEWPIPAYVIELRERLVLTFRLAGKDLGPLVPAPVTPLTLRGDGFVSLCLANGRCLKSVGGIPILASDFRTAELLTPVRWQPACRPTLRGLCALRFYSDSHGLVRLVRTALDLNADHTDSTPVRAGASRMGKEPAWPDGSAFDSAEHAEGALLHPEWYFAPDRAERLVHAVPVHQYARSTVALHPEQAPTAEVEGMLGLRPGSLQFDHGLIQKRCTHTFSFPPETIFRTRPAMAPPLQSQLALAA